MRLAESSQGSAGLTHLEAAAQARTDYDRSPGWLHPARLQLDICPSKPANQSKGLPMLIVGDRAQAALLANAGTIVCLRTWTCVVRDHDALLIRTCNRCCVQWGDPSSLHMAYPMLCSRVHCRLLATTNPHTLKYPSTTWQFFDGFHGTSMIQHVQRAVASSINDIPNAISPGCAQLS